MHRSFLLAAVLIGSVSCARASGSGATGAGTSAPMARASALPPGVAPQVIATGDSIFHAISCQRCHGAGGKGAANGPDLTSGEWLHITGTYDEIVQTITTGVPRASVKGAGRQFGMNPRGGPANLTDPQVRAVAAYVWSISRNK